MRQISLLLMKNLNQNLNERTMYIENCVKITKTNN